MRGGRDLTTEGTESHGNEGVCVAVFVGFAIFLTDKAVKPWVQGITALHEMLRIKEGAGRLVRPA